MSSQEKRVNLFICQTPFQNFIVSEIIQWYCSEDQNIVISSKGTVRSGSIAKLIQFRNENSFYSLIDLIRIHFVLNRVIRRSKYRSTNFYLPHHDGFFPNRIFFHKNAGVFFKINLYYEGILFLKYPSTIKYKKVHLFRQILSIPFGFWYKYSSQIYPLDSHVINCIYTPYPSLTVGSYTKVYVKLKPLKFNRVKNRVLIVCGWPSNYLEFEIKKIYSKIIEEITLGNDLEVLIKEHHADKSNFFDKVAKSKNFEYKLVDDQRPIEEILSLLAPSKIYFAYFSSALFNIRTIYKDDVEIQCFYPQNKYNELQISIKMANDLTINISGV